MVAFIQSIIDGLLIGGVYGVVAAGLSLLFGVLGIVNFAQAEFLMLGMYVAWFEWSYLGIDPLIGALGSLVVGFALGYVIQEVLVQRVMKAPHVNQIFLTVGLLVVMENGALLAFGSDLRSVHTPYQTEALRLGPYFIPLPQLAAFAASIVVAVGLWLVMTRTWVGRAIRATSQQVTAARAFGINTRTVYAIAFGLGTGLTAFGGGIILPYSAASPTAGAQYILLMFTVVTLGGLGSIMGTLIGGFVVGVIQSVSILLFPIQLQNLVLFVLFIGMLAFRPRGLLGRTA